MSKVNKLFFKFGSNTKVKMVLQYKDGDYSIVLERRTQMPDHPG